MNASSVKPKPKRANKVKVSSDELSKGDTQVNAANPTTPKPKRKAQAKASPQATPVKVEGKPPGVKKDGKGGGKGKRGKSEPRVEKRKQQCIYFYRGTSQRGDQCKYEHQVGDDGNPVPVGPEILQRFDDAVKRYNETRPQTQAKPRPAPRGEKNGLPDLSRELFWMGMHDIARKARRISGHTLDDLPEMLYTMAREPKPQIYAVKTIAVPEPSNVVFTKVPHNMHFKPSDVRKEIVKWFEHFHPAPNHNRGRLSGSAASLTFGAQTGRGSDRSCVIKRTLEHDYHSLMLCTAVLRISDLEVRAWTEPESA